MKRILYLLSIAIIATTLASCVGVKTSSQGLENDSFLLFVGDTGKYRGGVQVSVDDNESFIAQVQKDHADRPKGAVYAIATGSHKISVIHNNQLIYQKQIFIGAQETKKITLP